MSSKLETPLYVRIANEYRDRIIKGELQPNEAIPPQIELAKLHETSLVTIQKALGILVEEGLIARIRRKGTFVSGPGIIHRQRQALTRTPIRHVYFVYEEVLISLFSLDFHERMIRAMSEACEVNGIGFGLLTVDEASELRDGDGVAYVIYGMWYAPSDAMKAIISRWSSNDTSYTVVYSFYPHLRVPHINFDNLSGGYVATQHLVDLGHQRIGIGLGGGTASSEPDPEYSLRLEGYKLVLSNANLPFQQELVFWNKTDVFPTDEERGIGAIRYFMELAHPPSAIFATTDIMAYGAMREARRIGLRIPEDLSIIGYDDYAFTSWTTPPLTTVRQDTSLLGRMVIERLLSPPTSTAGNLILPELVVRGSTAAPSGSFYKPR